jgi:hypothetical protein
MFFLSVLSRTSQFWKNSVAIDTATLHALDEVFELISRQENLRDRIKVSLDSPEGNTQRILMRGVLFCKLELSFFRVTGLQTSHVFQDLNRYRLQSSEAGFSFLDIILTLAFIMRSQRFSCFFIKDDKALFTGRCSMPLKLILANLQHLVFTGSSWYRLICISTYNLFESVNDTRNF